MGGWLAGAGGSVVVSLTPERITELRALITAATDGPWTVEYDTCDCGDMYPCEHGKFPYALRLPTHTVSAADRPCDPADGLDGYRHQACEISDLTAETLEFIAAARTALPAALDDIAALLPAAKIYLQAIDDDPEHEYLTLPEAFLLTRLREAVKRHNPHTDGDDRGPH